MSVVYGSKDRRSRCDSKGDLSRQYLRCWIPLQERIEMEVYLSLSVALIVWTDRKLFREAEGGKDQPRRLQSLAFIGQYHFSSTTSTLQHISTAMVSSVVVSPADEVRGRDRLDPYIGSFDTKQWHVAPPASIAATQRDIARRRKSMFDAKERNAAKSMEGRSVSAHVENNRLLIIKTTPKTLRGVHEETEASDGPKNVPIVDDDDFSDGPSAKGTYSREHTLRHPEIQWIHRGQGRYLPASDFKKDMPPPAANRSSR
nr:hypothetical protein CFP56_52833 [Quercus suber]